MERWADLGVSVSFVLMKLHMEGPTSALPVLCTHKRIYMYQEINWL